MHRFLTNSNRATEQQSKKQFICCRKEGDKEVTATAALTDEAISDSEPTSGATASNAIEIQNSEELPSRLSAAGRSFEEENREFHSQWTELYCVLKVDNVAICLRLTVELRLLNRHDDTTQ
jgi:hypothetical protein